MGTTGLPFASTEAPDTPEGWFLAVVPYRQSPRRACAVYTRRVVWRVCSAFSHWLFTKKKVLFRRIGPPTLKPGMYCVKFFFGR